MLSNLLINPDNCYSVNQSNKSIVNENSEWKKRTNTSRERFVFLVKNEWQKKSTKHLKKQCL